MARVLLVDDDVDVLESLADWLRRKHEVRIATGFAAAMAALVDGHDFDVVITDYDMPPYRGDDLLAIVAARWPRVCRILHSGTPGVFGGVTSLQIDAVVAKGDPAELDAAIARCLPRIRHAW